MSQTTQVTSGGLNFGGLLTIVFITLKLTHVIDWSWWWVWAPMWVPLAFLLVILALCGIGWCIATLLERQATPRRIR